MQRKKIITCQIPIADPNKQLSGDLDNTILDIFNTNWKNKCYGGAYIISADKVLRRSQCEIPLQLPVAEGIITANLELTVIIFSKDDTVCGEVLKIDNNNNILLKSIYGPIYVEDENKELQRAIEKSIIPLSVVKVVYSINREVNFKCTTLKREHDRIAYKCKAGQLINIADILDESSNLEKKLESLKDKSSYNFFMKLFCKKVKSGSSIYNISTDFKKEVYLYKAVEYYGSPYYKQSVDEPDDYIIVEADYSVGIMAITSKYNSELHTLITLIETYKDTYNDYKYIWNNI